MISIFKRLSFATQFEELAETCKRFPLSTMCAGWVFVLTVLAIAEVDVFKEETTGRIVLSLALGYFWFGISQMVAEAKKFNSVKHIALALSGFIPLLFITFGETNEFFRLVFIFPALLLLIMVAPYVRENVSNTSFWVFNRNVWFGVAVSIVAGGILAAGLSSAIGAVNYLFDLGLKEKPFLYILTFCGTILTPLYALAFIPKKFNFDEAECSVPTQVNFIVNWILAPLIIVYMAILYAYFIKIGIAWEIPKGQLSFMITGFIGAGLVIYLVSWPLHDTQSKALKFFSKYFFIAMIIPVIMQAVSIWMRIDQYGFTEKRYIVAASAVWFAFIAIGFLLKKLKLKHIPLSLAVLLLLASWGPWSARDVSFASQYGRMETVLMQNGLFKNGRVVGMKEGEELPFEVRRNISGMADYIFRHDHEFCRYNKKYEFFKALNFKYVSRWENGQTQKAVRDGKFNFVYSKGSKQAVVVSGVDYYVPRQYVYKNKYKNARNNKKITDNLKASFEMLDEGVVRVVVGSSSPIKLDLTQMAKEQIKNNPENNKMLNPIAQTVRNSNYSVKIEIYNFSGEIKKDIPIVNSASAAFYITKR